MKISRNWLQTYFEKPLPTAEELDTALTFHALEIDGVDHQEYDDVLDVKITANRGHDCLSHRGIAKEISAILNIPMKDDPLSKPLPELAPLTKELVLDVQSLTANPVHCIALIRGVTVGPSPKWLVESLAAVGQRSINNVVDATNYVMLGLGAPTHAFDADKLKTHDGTLGIRTRISQGEKLQILGGTEYDVPTGALVLADPHDNIALDIAGIKGGLHAELNAATKNLVVSAGSYDPILIRKTSQKLKLRTDASQRFENHPPFNLPFYAIGEVVKIILGTAGGELIGYAATAPIEEEKQAISASAADVSAILGAPYTATQMKDVFDRLGYIYEQKGDTFAVTPTFTALEVVALEDIAEEVGRITGYDHVPSAPLPALEKPVVKTKTIEVSEMLREALFAQDFSEILTSVFSNEGESAVLNKVESDTPFLRSSLLPSMTAALEKNILIKDVVGVRRVKLFEIGSVWHDGKESMMLSVGVEKAKKQPAAMEILTSVLKSIGAKAAVEGTDTVASCSIAESVASISNPSAGVLPTTDTERYAHFSKYPFISRDIALWTTAETTAEEIIEVIKKSTSSLMVHLSFLDRFEKDGKVSYAFRMVFQSFDRTLIDEDASEQMSSITKAVQAKGWEVR